MNTFTRGVRNAFRNMIRSGSIVVILAISISLIIAMLAAKQAVTTKIETVKSSVGNTITVSPAGFRGFDGGGEPLTSADATTIASIANVTGVTSSLSSRLTTDDTTDLESGIELGSLGGRFQADNSSSDASTEMMAPDSDSSDSASSRPNPMSSITATGISAEVTASVLGGSTLTWTEGSSFSADSNDTVAVIGTALAEANDLSVGDTFSMYDTDVEIVGIYDAGTTFANNGVYMPLMTLQTLADQEDEITSMTVTVDSADNLATTTTAISDALGDSVDVTNNQDQADTTISSLESVSAVATYSLVGAVIAGAVIILLTMIMIVRERRREIGVMKAIGSSNIGIMKQFVVEAVTLTTLALAVGLVGGIAAATPITDMLVNNSSSSTQNAAQPGAMGDMRGGAFGRQARAIGDITASVGVDSILYGLGATLLIAILGSAVPSMMISKIKPAEAMRNE